MLSNLIINQQKFVIFVDDCGYELFSNKFIENWAKEQGEEVQIFDINSSVTCPAIIEDIHLKDKKSIILPSLATLLIYNKLSKVVQLFHYLKNNSEIKHVFLWATRKSISEQFVIPFIEYLADLVVHFIDDRNLTVLTKKSGGVVTHKQYNYKKTPNSFSVTKVEDTPKSEPIDPKPENIGTFKIELDDDEIVARNSIKMPYEDAIDEHQNGKGNVTYLPDASDDFDDEDPDEDLFDV